jgi:hypothetical protein
MGRTYEAIDPDFGKRVVAREPDALIDEKLFGHQVEWALWGDREQPFRKGQRDYGMPVSVPYYHEKISDAWLIVEELRNRGIVLSIKSCADLDPNANNCEDLIKLKTMKFCVQRWNKNNQKYDPGVYAVTAQQAICTLVIKFYGW